MHGAIIWTYKMPKRLGATRKNINDTSFTKCHSGQKGGMITRELFLNMAMKRFAIFDQDMTQIIYENYLGILGVREI